MNLNSSQKKIDNNQADFYYDISNIENKKLKLSKIENKKLQLRESKNQLKKSSLFIEKNIEEIHNLIDIKILCPVLISLKLKTLKEKGFLRPHQERAFNDFVQKIQEEKLEKGSYKKFLEYSFVHPTGAGKTVLFCEMIKAMIKNTIVLAPKEDLVSQTVETLKQDLPKNTVVLSRYDFKNGKEAAEQFLKISETKNVFFVTTYNFLRDLKNNNEELFEKFIKKLGLIVSDEAHRSLGEQTQNTYEDLKEKINEVLQERENLLHLAFTATPDLLDKSVQKIYEDMELVNQVSVNELIENETLVEAKTINLGEAILETDEDNITQSKLDKLSNNFNIDGKNSAQVIKESYLKEFEKNGDFLPSIGFCRTIAQAIKIYQDYFSNTKIKCAFCFGEAKEALNTLNKKEGTSFKNLNAEEAKKSLESGEVDLVFTCQKLAEGSDIPTARAALMFAPIRSKANWVQAVGRVVRTVKKEKTTAEKTPQKTKDGSFLQPKKEKALVFQPTYLVAKRNQAITNKDGEIILNTKNALNVSKSVKDYFKKQDLEEAGGFDFLGKKEKEKQVKKEGEVFSLWSEICFKFGLDKNLEEFILEEIKKKSFEENEDIIIDKKYVSEKFVFDLINKPKFIFNFNASKNDIIEINGELFQKQGVKLKKINQYFEKNNENFNLNVSEILNFFGDSLSMDDFLYLKNLAVSFSYYSKGEYFLNNIILLDFFDRIDARRIILKEKMFEFVVLKLKDEYKETLQKLEEEKNLEETKIFFGDFKEAYLEFQNKIQKIKDKYKALRLNFNENYTDLYLLSNFIFNLKELFKKESFLDNFKKKKNEELERKKEEKIDVLYNDLIQEGSKLIKKDRFIKIFNLSELEFSDLNEEFIKIQFQKKLEEYFRTKNIYLKKILDDLIEFSFFSDLNKKFALKIETKIKKEEEKVAVFEISKKLREITKQKDLTLNLNQANEVFKKIFNESKKNKVYQELLKDLIKIPYFKRFYQELNKKNRPYLK